MPWSEPAGVFLLIAASAALSALATAWARAHALRRGLLDAPGERRSHSIPTPRGGGIGITLVGLCACAYVAWRGEAGWWWHASGLLLVATAGGWDDHHPLPAWPRLLAHVIAGACLAAGLAAQGAGLPVLLAALVAVPVLVNVWNFMDGIDGLIASQSLLVAASWAWVLDGSGRVLAIALAAACLGFLPFNFPRARIFLGDIGSGALGYLLAVLLANGMAGSAPEAWPLLLLPAVACLTDSGMTLGWRALHGEAWWRPHVQHLYQQLARRSSHPTVTLLYAGWTALAGGSMLAARQAEVALGWGAVALFFGLTLLAWLRLHGETKG